MNKISLVVISAFLSACTSISVTTPTPIVETPEVHGSDEMKVGISARLQSGHDYKASDNANARPPNLTAPSSAHTLAGFAGAHLNLLKRIKLGLNLDPMNSGTFATAQIQLLGDGRSQGKKGNFSLSVFGHSGRGTGSSSGDQSTTYGPGGQNWSAKITADWIDYGASIGYRTDDKTILFIGASQQKVWYSTTIEQTNGTPPTGTYRAKDDGEGKKAAIGASFISERGEVFLMADYTEYRYGLAESVFITSGSLGFTFR